MKTHTTKWLVAGAMGAGMLAFAMAANAAGTTGTTGANVSLPMPSKHLQLAAEDCGAVIKASAVKDDKMADDAMKTDKMAKDAMKTDEMAKDAMKTDEMAKDAMKTDVMAKATDCAGKDTM